MNPRDAKYLFYDYGLFTSMAEKLARDLGRDVDYFCPWEHSYSDGRELLVGRGVPGLNRIKYFDKVVDDADVIVFPDCHDGELQDYLRRHGYRVWGSGLGSALELKRWKTKQQMDRAGLPVARCYKIHGLAALRAFFKENPNDRKWYVKISELRGLGETWCARDYREAKAPMDEFAFKHAGLAALVDFIVELGIPDAKEAGYDGLSIDGKFPKRSHWGVEKKDRGYVGKVSAYDDLPEDMRALNEGLSKHMAQLKHRNWFSTELRDEYGIDITCRQASPAGECLIENMTNLPEVLYHGAEGDLVEPEYEFDYVAQVILCSDFALESLVPVFFEEKLRPFVKLYNHARIELEEIGVCDCFIPQVAPQKQIGSVVALANNCDHAIEQCQERVKEIHAFELETDQDCLYEAYEELQGISAPA